ncbi:hypothetical protein BX616_001084 [Lobosporangium transversale]|nr:hypothetical protein BX616_001084 [Lobosporangium transversale]
MFGSMETPSRSILSPAQALRLFDIYIKGARTIDDDNEIVMELCLDADSVLSRIQRPGKRSFTSASSVSSTSNGDIVLRKNIASAYHELACLFTQLGHLNLAQRRDKKAEKWGYIQGDNSNGNNGSNTSNNNSPSNNSNSNSNSTRQESSEVNGGRLSKMVKLVQSLPVQAIATISKNIFNNNRPPTIVRYSVPKIDANLNDIHQLVYCLSLVPTAPAPTTDLNDHEKKWCQTISDDPGEYERLRKLASDVIEMFINDEIKAEATVAEVVALAPVLDRGLFTRLLMAFINGISRNIMLQTHLLEGLAQLMQRAPPGYLDSDDLVSILNALNSRLRVTHGQSGDHLYRMSATVSHVLDAMVNNQIKGLKRGQLHEPLAAYLKQLKESPDPHLVYQAAYAFQALLYIPDDETTMQSMLRRTSVVLRGVFGVVSAVKDVNMKVFMDEISNIQKELPSVIDIMDLSLQVYKDSTSLYESGATFKQCMEEGLIFSRRSAWYPALRVADALLQTGELIKFKTLVCEASCRNDAVFQWGLCQRLGQIAADAQWSMDARQDAITFLGEIYMNDQEWGSHVHVKQWIIHILRKLSSLPLGLQGTLLDDLEKHGSLEKQEVYRSCLQEPMIQHPFTFTLPLSTSSHLLDRVQKKPDVENSLRQLKRRRVEAENNQGFYIQQYAKASPQASDTKLFLLMDKVKEFLDSDRKVLLVQGDSGAGKSTFNRALERTLWDTCQSRHGRIPLFINLPAIDKPEKDLVAKQLRDYGFTDSQIKELKMNRPFILICDGYDESLQTSNLYVANRLNQPGEWEAQMVISCRSEYLGLDYRDRFQPMDRNHQADAGLFQEAVIMPFNETQIDDYIEQYVTVVDPLWRVDDYRRALKMVPSLQDLVKNPFILSMSLEVLPRMVDPSCNISSTKIKRITLYDQFVELWLERGKKRLGETLRPEDRKMFRIFTDEGFAQNGIKYLTELAIAIYRHQDGNPVVEYSPFKDKGTWKEAYFSKENRSNLLREASPLTRTGIQHRFLHRSILEYSLVRAIFEPQPATTDFTSEEEAKATTSLSRRQSISSVFSFEDMDIKESEQEVDLVKADETSPLVWRSFVDEPSILQFLEDRVRLEPMFKQQLCTYLELSKGDDMWRIAAANAMTILIRAGESFIDADLRGIQIPGADLSHGVFEYAQLQGADLRKVNLRNCWLREADLSEAKMAGVQFGEWPLLEVSGEVYRGSYSPNGKTLAAVIEDESTAYAINIYDTSTWEKLLTLKHDGSGYRFVYSPNSQHVASWGRYPYAILILDTTSGALVHRLEGHTRPVLCAEYSPNGNDLASASEDASVRVWDTQSGVLKHMLEGHTDAVRSVAYSPDGKQIATGGNDAIIRLWDATSGQQLKALMGEFRIDQIVYSPNSQEIVTCCDQYLSLPVWDARSGQKLCELEHDKRVCGIQYSPDGKFAASFTSFKVFLRNMQTRQTIHTLEGHSSSIQDVKYSPNGEQIATCSWDTTVRLWDVKSAQLMNIFYGHSNLIYRVAYSPSGHQVASFSRDGTVRLWDSQPQHSTYALHSHPKSSRRTGISPDGQQITSFSGDGMHVDDARTGQPIYVLQSPDGNASYIKYSPDSQLLASYHESLRVYLWDAQSGQIIRTLEVQGEQGDVVYSLDFSATSRQMICGHFNGKVTMWDTQTGELIRTLQSHDKRVEHVVFSPNGRQIASYDNYILRVWTAQTGALQYEITIESFRPMYSPDSRKLVLNHGVYSGIFRIWDAETGELCYEIEFDSPSAGLTFSPCSQHMAIGIMEGLISVVDIDSGSILHKFEGHIHGPNDMAYSSDGKYFASASGDRTVRVWDPESGQCLIVIPYVTEQARMLKWNVSDEGYFLVTVCADNSIRKWQIVQDGGQYQYLLRWRTGQTALNASNTCIHGVDKLSETNRKLLEQRGAINKQSRPLAIHEGPKHILATPLMTSKAVSSQADLHQVASVETGLGMKPLTGVPLPTMTTPSRSIRDYRFKYSMCNECSYAHIISCKPRN